MNNIGLFQDGNKLIFISFLLNTHILIFISLQRIRTGYLFSKHLSTQNRPSLTIHITCRCNKTRN